MKNYYKILGVRSNAPGYEIVKAYQKKHKAWHPKKHPTRKNHSEFLEVQEAFHIIGNDQRRKVYHALLAAFVAGTLVTSHPGFRQLNQWQQEFHTQVESSFGTGLFDFTIQASMEAFLTDPALFFEILAVVLKGVGMVFELFIGVLLEVLSHWFK